MPLNAKSQLQYERDFCDMMHGLGWHAERVASSGKRQLSVCDAVLFTASASYLTEVKATRKVRFVFEDDNNIVGTAQRVGIRGLLAIYFKSSHSSQGKGNWVFKILNENRTVVNKNDKSDGV